MEGSDADLWEITRAQERGDTLTAYDLAKQSLDAGRGDLGLRYHLVLALTRLGLTEHAIDRYIHWDLRSHLVGDRRSEIVCLAARLAEFRAAQVFEDIKLSGRAEFPARTDLLAAHFGRAYEDIAALGGLIYAEKAWKSHGADRCIFAQRAADIYAQVYEDTRGVYVGINCAVMRLLAGDPSTAAALADQILANSGSQESSLGENEKYLFSAMMTQAQLLSKPLGDLTQESLPSLTEMKTRRPKHLAEASRVTNQICGICDQLSKNSERSKEPDGSFATLMEAIPQPSIIHYCGHMASVPGAIGRFPACEVPRVQNDINRELDDLDVGAGYGSLACGADILFAEALLERNAELHVILPFDRQEFIETSVRRGGSGWIHRFQRCWDQATSRTITTLGGYMGDIVLFRHGSDIAMGQALLRAETLRLPCHQIVVWDSENSGVIAGTSGNIGRWKKNNEPSRLIRSRPKSDDTDIPYASRVIDGQGYGREVRACLFGDIKGFSNLDEARLPSFSDTVIKMFADVIREFQSSIDHFNTWGDGIYLVLKDTATAAECALRLQESMVDSSDDFVASGLPADLSLRLGGHVGPVLLNNDAVHKKLTWCGSTIAKAARIEPVTPPGEIFVSDAFAAVLAVEAGNSKFHCHYEGNLPSAKGYGNFRMYRLTRKRKRT